MLDRDRPACQVIRRKLVRYGWFEHPDSLSMHYPPPPRDEWVVEACGTPLFTADEKQAKCCRSCLDGYSHPENYLATKAQIVSVDPATFDREFLKSVGIGQD